MGFGYRLNIVQIGLPPLRERKEDIPILVSRLVTRQNERLKKTVQGVSDKAMEALLAYHWPGNIRELENVIERSVLFCEDGAQHLDLPVDYESLVQVGSFMGSGGLIVMDDTSCMVAVAAYFMEFCRDESCGKCIPCRAGTVQMHGLLQRICRGEGTEADLARLEELAELLKATSLCGLGQGAPNPVVSTLRYFREEYLAHVRACPSPWRPGSGRRPR